MHEIQKVLVLSTAHVPEVTARSLDGHGRFDSLLPMHANYEFGWLVWCDEEDGNGWRGAYPELARVIDYASGLGCHWVRFDKDAEKIDKLPSWSW